MSHVKKKGRTRPKGVHATGLEGRRRDGSTRQGATDSCCEGHPDPLGEKFPDVDDPVRWLGANDEMVASADAGADVFEMGWGEDA